MLAMDLGGNVEHLEESSGDLNGLTASASSQHPQELFVPPFAAQKCFRCEENRVISMLERRSRMFQWTDRPHDEDDQHGTLSNHQMNSILAKKDLVIKCNLVGGT